MKTKVTINGVEYNLDLEKAKELGVLKEDTICKSWEEFFEKYRNKRGLFYDEDNKKIEYVNTPINTIEQLTDNEAIAIKAFSKLLKLRRDCIEDWNPDWSNDYDDETKYCVAVLNNKICIKHHYFESRTFSFPTKEMAEEFLECFRELLEDCKYLI